jgi:DNA polymerase-1
LKIDFAKIPLPREAQHLSSISELNLNVGLKLLRHVDGAVAIDTEGTGIHVLDGRDYAHGISFAFHSPFGLISHYMPFRHKNGENLDPRYLRMAKDAIEGRVQDGGIIVYHNSKYDIEALHTLGIDVRGYPHYDTMLMCHLLREEYPMQKSLDACTKFYLNDPGKKMSSELQKFIKLFGWGAVSSDMMYEYASYDASLTYRLFCKLWPLWQKEKLDSYWLKHKLRTLNTVRKMELRGVLLDQELCERSVHLGTEVMQDITSSLGDYNLGSPNDLKEILINQLGLPVLKRTKTGRPSFDKEAMADYDIILERQSSPLAAQILEYRGWQKSVSSNYSAYLELVSPDGRLRPNYKLHGTKTGRFSCEKPNLQQIPRNGDKPWNGKMKQCFIPRQGYVLLEADYSQLELRLATAYAQVPSLLEVFSEGRDIFTEMASEIGLNRQDTKTFVYSTQYGAGLNRLMNVFGWDKNHAQSVRATYKKAYPAFDLLSNKASAKVRSSGKVALWSGRSRHFEYKDTQAHKAFNSIIQGGAADIMERALYTMEENTLEDEFRLLLQVHDSAVAEVREDKVDYYKNLMRDTMTNVTMFDGNKFPVTFAVDVHTWGS